MHILVDYDNIDQNLTRNGTLAVATRIVDALARLGVGIPGRCTVNLYGGWYEDKTFTKAAQRVSADHQLAFPAAIRWNAGAANGICLVAMEMAVSLKADPSRHILYTYRTRPFSAYIRCNATLRSQCAAPSCPLPSIETFLQNRRCTIAGCAVLQKDFLSKSEQKLIDTMLTSDLIYLAQKGERDLAVVSSDDDLWPGIRTALMFGGNVTQIHTRTGRRTRRDYSSGVPSTFRQIHL